MRRPLAFGLLLLATGCATVEREPPMRTAGPPAEGREAKRALFVEAYRRFGAGDFDAAARGLEKLVDHYDELEDYCLHYLAASEARTGRASEALALWQRLATEHPKSRFALDARLQRGLLLRERGELEASRGELMEVLREGTSDQARDALWELALLDEADGNVALAYARLMRIRREVPGTAQGQRAKDLVMRLRREDPSLAPAGDALESELRLLIAERDNAPAVDLANRLLDSTLTDRKPSLLLLRADAERALGSFDTALQSLREVVRLYPRSEAAPEALYRYSSWLWNRDRDDEAKEGFREYRRRFPTSRRADVLYALARIDEAAQRDDDAIALYAELAGDAPQTKEGGEALWRIGWIRYRAAQWSAAVQAFERARSADDSVSSLYWRARASERAGDRAVAEQIYERILNGDPSGYYAQWAEQRLGRSSVPGTVRREADPVREIGSPPAASDTYHLIRARELLAAALRPLARAELQAFERANGERVDIGQFLIASYPCVDGYRDAIRLAHTLGVSDAEVLYPLAFWGLVRQRAQASHLDPLLVLALIRQESLFDPAARSPADARGLMQLLPATARRVAEGIARPLQAGDLYEPELNITLGVAYLDQLLREQGGDWVKALAAYNGGEDALAKWDRRFGQLPADEFVESITYRETRDYVKKVLSHYRRYVQTYSTGGQASGLHTR
jgi:peptidoglycan lytic transglycosylase